MYCPEIIHGIVTYLPRIFSHAHGGTSWKLGRARAA